MDYFELYKDVWNFHKKYQQVQTTDEYWQQVVDESNQIAKKYNQCKFAKDLLLAIIGELERIYKELIENANTAI